MGVSLLTREGRAEDDEVGVGGKMVNVLPNVGRDVEVVDSSYSSCSMVLSYF